MTCDLCAAPATEHFAVLDAGYCARHAPDARLILRKHGLTPRGQRVRVVDDLDVVLVPRDPESARALGFEPAAAP